jgi:hypothetical protein
MGERGPGPKGRVGEGGGVAADSVCADGAGDVLEALLADVLENQIEPVADMVSDGLRAGFAGDLARRLLCDLDDAKSSISSASRSPRTRP